MGGWSTHLPVMRLLDRSIRCRPVKTFMMLAAGNLHARSAPAKAPSSNR